MLAGSCDAILVMEDDNVSSIEPDGSSFEEQSSGTDSPRGKVGDDVVSEGGVDSSICSICGNRKSDGNGSLTQWLVMCGCDGTAAPQSLQDLSLGVCYQCGKRTREGRSGSISQFIFQRDFCSCNSPESVSVLLQGPNLAGYELKGTPKDEPELEVSPYLFPTDRFKPLSMVESDSDGASYLARDRILDSVVLVSVAHTLNEADAQAFLEKAKELCKVETKSSRPKLLNVGVTIAAIPYIVTQVCLDDDVVKEQEVAENSPDSSDDGLDSSSVVLEKEGTESVARATATGEGSRSIEGKVFVPFNLRAVALAKFIAFVFGILSVFSLVAIWAQSVLKEPGLDHISAPVKNLDPDDSLSSSISLYEDNKWNRMMLDDVTVYDAGPFNTDEDFAQLTKYNDVSSVRVSSSASITGTGLEHLRKFKLVSVQLDSQAVSDEGLRVVSTFPTLKCVGMGWSDHVTDAGLNELLKLKRLEILAFDHMKIPPGTISVVEKIPTLTEVQFAVTEGLKRKELSRLSVLPRLRTLFISTSGMTDDDCSTLSKLPHIEELLLMRNELTDGGVAHLARLPLVKLDLSGNDVTDRSLKILAAVPTLKELTIVDCPRVSEAAKQAFLEARSKCWLADTVDGERRRGAK